MIRRFATAALALVFGGLPAQDHPATVDLQLRNIRILDVETGNVSQPVDIAIAGGRIASISPAGLQDPTPNAIDGTGKFVIPGLADMHVHTSARVLPLFIANGVTTVRELNGSERHLEMRQRVNTGAILGPTMYVSTTLIAGATQPHRHALITTEEQADSLVRESQRSGYDFIKIYDGLSSEVYEALIAAASTTGMGVVGHIPEDVGVDRVLASGQSIEHVEQLIHNVFGHEADTTLMDSLATVIRESGTTVTPTLAAIEALSLTADAEVDKRFDAEINEYVAEATLAWWNTIRRRGQSTSARARLHFARHRVMTRALFDAGVPLLVGTDTPNPLMVPGFSIHEEMRVLTEAGIPAIDVLRATTLGAAEYLGVADSFGKVVTGYIADLVVIDDNPVTSPETLRHPAIVIVRGRAYDRASLDSILGSINN